METKTQDLRAPWKVVIDDLEKFLESAFILEPDRSPSGTAAAVLAELPRDVREILAAQLLLDRVTGMARRLQPKPGSQMLLPGFEHLPPAIKRFGKTKVDPVPLLDATFTVLRQYHRELTKRHTSKKAKDKRLVEAKALMARMKRWTKKNPAVTVKEMLALEAAREQAKLERLQ